MCVFLCFIKGGAELTESGTILSKKSNRLYMQPEYDIVLPETGEGIMGDKDHEQLGLFTTIQSAPHTTGLDAGSAGNDNKGAVDSPETVQAASGDQGRITYARHLLHAEIHGYPMPISYIDDPDSAPERILMTDIIQRITTQWQA